MKKYFTIIVSLLLSASLYAQDGVVINGVTWAISNVDESGAFAGTPESQGKLFQWSRSRAWAISDGDIGKEWQTFPEDQKEWVNNNPYPAGWRAPNSKEWDRLLDSKKVQSEWTVQNGVEGVKFTDLENGNSIFLPAAGERDALKGVFKNGGTVGNYWGYSKTGSTVYGLTFNTKKVQGKRFPELDTGYSLRCVHAQDSPYLAAKSGNFMDKEIMPGLKLGDALGKAVEASIADINKKAEEAEASDAIKRQYEEEEARKRAEIESKKEERRQKAEAQKAEQEQFLKLAKEKLDYNGATVSIKGVDWATKNVDSKGTFVGAQQDKGKYYSWGSVKYAYTRVGGDLLEANIKGMLWPDASNPCPSGYRVPTCDEMLILKTAEARSFTYNGVSGTLLVDNGSFLFIPGSVYWSANGINSMDVYAHYMEVSDSRIFVFENMNRVTVSYKRSYAMSIRCVRK